MNDRVLKLINIVEELFILPDRTDGQKILMDLFEISNEVNKYWPSDGDNKQNWQIGDLEIALRHKGMQFITRSDGERAYIAIPR